jgi:endo-1,4-beta-xylanase
MDWPSLGQVDSMLNDFGKLGVKVMITELDISVLPNPGNNYGADVSQNYELQKKLNPYKDGLPDSVSQALADRYASIFKVLEKHSDIISRVTFWGVRNGDSWLNNWPVRGRTNYPLLFDRSGKPNAAFYEVIKTVKSN